MQNNFQQKVFKPAKVLIVDDNEKTRNILKRRIAFFGHEAYQAESADKGFILLKKKKADVILIELNMKTKNGYEMLCELKKEKRYRNIPVIMLSSNDDIDSIVLCLENGAEDYLIKPFNQTLLKARLNSCISKKESYDKEQLYLAQIKNGQDQIIVQEKMASIGNVANMMSHELKNPLNLIINFSEICQNLIEEIFEKTKVEFGNISKEGKDFISSRFNMMYTDLVKIQEHGKKADKILRFMLDQTQISAEQLHPGNINSMINEVVKIFKTEKEDINLDFLELNLDQDIPHINIVIVALSKVISNILENSVYALKEKFPDFNHAQLKISTINNTDSIQIEIFDNGSGMSEDVVEKCFDPFFTTKPEGVGSGLGLSSLKNLIINKHKGFIDIQSREGEYTIFILKIPKQIENDEISKSNENNDNTINKNTQEVK